MNIGLRNILVPQTRFVVMVAISLVLLVSGTEEDLILLDVLEVMVDFAVRLLGGKWSTRVVLEISLQHPRVTFASNRVISIKLVHGNQGKIRVGFVLLVIPLISVLFIRRLRLSTKTQQQQQLTVSDKPKRYSAAKRARTMHSVPRAQTCLHSCTC